MYDFYLSFGSSTGSDYICVYSFEHACDIYLHESFLNENSASLRVEPYHYGSYGLIIACDGKMLGSVFVSDNDFQWVCVECGAADVVNYLVRPPVCRNCLACVEEVPDEDKE